MVRGRRRHGGEDRDRQQDVAAVLAQLRHRDDPQAGHGEDHQRDLEHETDRRKEDDAEPVVVLRLDEDVEVVVVEVLQEPDGPFERDEVAEQHAGDEEDRPEEHERDGELALLRRERG